MIPEQIKELGNTIKGWRERLHHLELDESQEGSSNHLFDIRKKIEECTKKLSQYKTRAMELYKDEFKYISQAGEVLSQEDISQEDIRHLKACRDALYLNSSDVEQLEATIFQEISDAIKLEKQKKLKKNNKNKALLLFRIGLVISVSVTFIVISFKIVNTIQSAISSSRNIVNKPKAKTQLMRNRVSPETFVEDYFAAIEKAEYEVAWNMLSKDVNPNRRLANTLSEFKYEWAVNMSFDDQESRLIKNNGDSAEIKIKWTYCYKEKNEVLELDGAWFLSWNETQKKWLLEKAFYGNHDENFKGNKTGKKC